MANNEKNELSELLSQLGYSETKARQTEKEITAAEQLLRREDQLAVSDEILRKLQDRVKAELRAGNARRRQHRLLGRVAAAAAIAAVLMVAVTIQWHQPPIQPGGQSGVEFASHDNGPIFTEEDLRQDMAAWDLALSQDNQWADEVDDLLLDEVLIMWNLADWDLENLLGKEHNDESKIIYSGDCISGYFRIT